MSAGVIAAHYVESAPPAGWSRVGAPAVTNGTNGTIAGVAWPQSPTAGNLLLVTVYGIILGAYTFVISNTGTTGTAASVNTTNAGGHAIAIFQYWKIATGGDADPTINVTARPVSQFTTVITEEWSGTTATAPVRVASAATKVQSSNSGTVTNSISPTAGDLVLTSVLGYSNPGGASFGGGSVTDQALTGANGLQGAIGKQTAAATGAISPSFTFTSIGAVGSDRVVMAISAAYTPS